MSVLVLSLSMLNLSQPHEVAGALVVADVDNSYFLFTTSTQLANIKSKLTKQDHELFGLSYLPRVTIRIIRKKHN